MWQKENNDMTNHQENDAHNYLGYLYHYPNFTKPTPFRLDICLTEKPTEKHYDPKSVTVSVAANDPDNIIEQIKIVHPMRSTKERKVCPGIIRMIDRKNKVEEALMFGGNLKIRVKEDVTVLTFTSTAPIIKITNTTKLDELFRDEIKILWAEQRASRLSQPEAFENRLVNADPLELYQASLGALIKKYRKLHHHASQEEINMLHYLETRATRLKRTGYLSMAPEPQIKDIL
jgi:hypothetical protein